MTDTSGFEAGHLCTAFFAELFILAGVCSPYSAVRDIFFAKALAFLLYICYNIIRPCVGRSHTSRGGSGALYLKSAIAGVHSPPEGCSCVVCTVAYCVEKLVLRNTRL